MISILYSTLLLAALTASPLPALPYVTYIYISYDFPVAFTIISLAGSIAFCFQYFLGSTFLFLVATKFPLTYRDSRALAIPFQSITPWRLYLLRLTGIIPFKLTNIACGIAKLPFLASLIATFLASIPWQLLTYSVVKPSSLLVERYLNGSSSYYAHLIATSALSLILLSLFATFVKRYLKSINSST